MRPISPALVDVFEIRGALEGLAAEWAAERASDEKIEEMERCLVASAMIEAKDLKRIVEIDSDFNIPQVAMSVQSVAIALASRFIGSDSYHDASVAHASGTGSTAALLRQLRSYDIGSRLAQSYRKRENTHVIVGSDEQKRKRIR